MAEECAYYSYKRIRVRALLRVRCIIRSLLQNAATASLSSSVASRHADATCAVRPTTNPPQLHRRRNVVCCCSHKYACHTTRMVLHNTRARVQPRHSALHTRIFSVLFVCALRHRVQLTISYQRPTAHHHPARAHSAILLLACRVYFACVQSADADGVVVAVLSAACCVLLPMV